MKNPFINAYDIVPKNGGFHMPEHHVWCSSAIKGEDGKFHLYASCWPEKYGFGSNWLLRSRIAHAISDKPEGPYQFHSIIFEDRGLEYFDARSQHNPAIKYHDGTYYLYYFGTTFGGDLPGENEDIPKNRFTEIWDKKRIGVATSSSVYGPWKRLDKPILEPRDCRYWDCTCTTNPTVAILPTGKTYMIYKSRASCQSPLQLGVVVGESPVGPFKRLSDEPLFQFDNPKWFVEDPFLWYENDHFCLLMKDDFRDDSGGITGEWGSGVYAQSKDCLHWEIANPPKAYSRTITFDDGTTTTLCHLERANLLFDNGKPTHMFGATAYGKEPWVFDGPSFSICIPLNLK